MAYNHAQEEAEWQREEDESIDEMRQSGMSEEDIETMLRYDRMVFNSNRRYQQRLQDNELEAAAQIGVTDKFEIRTVEDLLDDIDDPTLHQILIEADTFTLKLLLLKVQGYSTNEICLQFGIDEGVIYGRIRRLRDKIVNNS